MRSSNAPSFRSARRGIRAIAPILALLTGCAGTVRALDVGPNHPANPAAAVAVDSRTAPMQPAAASPASPTPMTGREHRGATTDEKNVQAPGSVPAPAPGSTPESASLQQRLDDTVAAYLGLQRALAKDDLAAAEAAVTNLRSAADVLVIASDGDTRAAAQKLVAATPTAVERIEVLRDAFKAVSTAVVDLVHARHPSRAVAGAVRVAYCPMAKATWIQTEPDIANPYFGAAMPTCGSIRETLEATEPSKGGK